MKLTPKFLPATYVSLVLLVIAPLAQAAVIISNINPDQVHATVHVAGGIGETQSISLYDPATFHHSVSADDASGIYLGLAQATLSFDASSSQITSSGSIGLSYNNVSGFASTLSRIHLSLTTDEFLAFALDVTTHYDAFSDASVYILSSTGYLATFGYAQPSDSGSVMGILAPGTYEFSADTSASKKNIGDFSTTGGFTATLSFAPVPEPASSFLCMFGGALCFAARRRGLSMRHAPRRGL